MENSYQIPDKTHSIEERLNFWKRMLAEQEAKGITTEEFCRKHQITSYTMRQWKSRLRKIENQERIKDKGNFDKKAGKQNSGKFVPVKLAIDIAEHSKEVAQDGAIKIIFKNGHCIAISPILAEEALFFILQSVANLAC